MKLLIILAVHHRNPIAQALQTDLYVYIITSSIVITYIVLYCCVQGPPALAPYWVVRRMQTLGSSEEPCLLLFISLSSGTVMGHAYH